jgi:hypothetical protein
LPYQDDNHDVLFDLSPSDRFLDLQDPRIKAGMEITKDLTSDMRSVTERQGIRFIVVVIPTKERVYSELLRRAGYPAKYPRLAEAFVQEDVARAAIIELLHEQNIEVLDLLSPLEAQVRNRDLYQLADPHPNREGYRVIAEKIDRYLNLPRK